MSLQYLIQSELVKRQTHRNDLDDLMVYFFGDATDMINNRLDLDLIAPLPDNSENAVLDSHPAMYRYAALVSAYEYINELDMADHFMQRFQEQASRYYVSDGQVQTVEIVMGETASVA